MNGNQKPIRPIVGKLVAIAFKRFMLGRVADGISAVEWRVAHIT
jgi:hypothetical protein